RPRLCLAQAISALRRGCADQAEPLIEAAERTSAITAGEQYQPSVGRAASILANIPAVTAIGRADLARLRGDTAGEAAGARHGPPQLTERDGLLLGSFGRYHLAMAEWLGGRIGPAERGLGEVVAERSAAGERYLAVRTCHDLGHVQQAQGRLGAALHTYQAGLEIAAEPARLPLPAARIPHL